MPRMATPQQRTAAERYWNSVCFDVNEAMRAHVQPFVTPVSMVLADDHGELLGTGSYIEINGRRYLLTNEHVARALNHHSIAHQFSGTNNVFRCINPMVADPAPVDAALALIEDRVWGHCGHTASAIPLCRFATTHAPVPGELLFLVGYAGARARFLFNTLIAPGTPYLTQETLMQATHGRPEYHFALPYAPDRAISPEQRAQPLPTPPGMSGSLVWNTRVIECHRAGIDWTPAEARVTGIVWGWPDVFLIATKVEHLRLADLAAEASRQALLRAGP